MNTRIVKRIIFSLAPVLALAVLVEGIMCATYTRNDLLYGWERPEGGIRLQSDGTALNNPGYAVERKYPGAPFTRTNNAQGLREKYDLPCGSSPPRADKMVVGLGPSWMYGFGLNDGETIPDRLETLLSRDGEKVEVINAGVPGGSARSQLRVWVQLQACLPKVDGVLIGTPLNYLVQGRVEGSDEQGEWYREHTWSEPVLHLRTYLFLRRVKYRILSSYGPPPASTVAVSVVESTVRDLQQIISRARNAGVRVWFVDWPAGQHDHGLAAAHFTPMMHVLATTQQVPLAGYAMIDPTCWWVDGLHPNAAGAWAIAQTIAPMIETGLEGKAWSQSRTRSTTPSCRHQPQVERAQSGPNPRGG